MDTFRGLKLSGPISVERRVKPLPVLNSRIILLFGLTGAGKSNFLEVLSGNAELNISGNSLESVTEEITVYKLVNVKYKMFDEPIFLIDCPGFCDSKTSEFRIIKMIQDWIYATKSRGLLPPDHNISIIFYFHRITDKRLSASQKQTLQLIGSLVGDPYKMETQLAVVTTMWDTLWRPEQFRDAETRFSQLKECLKEFLGSTSEYAFRFDNTQLSALHIIDQARTIHLPDSLRANMRRSANTAPYRAFHEKKLGEAPFAPQLLQILNDRVARIEQSIRLLNDDIQKLEQDAEENMGARNELWGMKKSAEEALEVVLQERCEFLALSEQNQPRPNIARRMLDYIHERMLK
ncbi:hypothetical protein CVT24_013417 [Panaeolus cyanescens]|uniref:G domain-containing protein n=1 Tax=Panaeolus cyanescens TaxID=181874 RepID=A0A409YMT4_9AGAR|nr:hypothetical protein CVT24_013417 [Panaeolus cyanescens]